ncbi:MAG: hypothetical protein CL676_12125 [Bdellovibrionaceae bacterium]|nr:hypothetical protein [Pseudobdellovibrionaceae bacterium]|tara:strand:- start:1343 stop:2599 length:1257 start_codon:yes stop_codon:yes gene_type:complete
MKTQIKHFAIVSLSLVIFTSCTSFNKKKELVQVKDSEIFLMTYNLENLFDTKDDEGKNDEEFLPRSIKNTTYYQNLCFTRTSKRFRQECLDKDWSETIYKRKISRLVDVISRVNDGNGPDVLIAEEVENIHALKDLAAAMPQFNYKTVELIEGPDERGIDVGVISRLPMKSSMLHVVDFEKIKYSLKTQEQLTKERTAHLTKKDENSLPEFTLAREDVSDIKENYPTRGILQVELELPDGESLYVLGAHLPSQRSSTGYRRVVLEKLSQIKKELPEKALVFAAGDFNISAGEDAQKRLYGEQAARDWVISHKIGCKSCAGTYYYHRKREWSFFDVFLFEKELTNGQNEWQVDPNSIAVFNKSLYQFNRWGSPGRFGNGKHSTGVSDHWPLVAKLVRTPNAEQKEDSKENSKTSEEVTQ